MGTERKHHSLIRAGITATVASAVLHIAAGVGISSGALTKGASERVRAIKVRIEEKKPEPPPPAPEPPPPPPPPPKPKEKPKPKKVATEREKPKEKPPEPVQPIQGLSKDSFASEGTGSFSAPVGNTLMEEDKGIRVQEAPPMDEDLSADAKLIPSSVITPEYTDAALDANFEGYITVEVFVDVSGAVTDTELKKKVGYGMDARILEAARRARFTPRKNKLGGALAGWTELKFNLQIP